jgi:UDP-glucose 4-epimerase
MNAEDCKLDPVLALEFNGLATSRIVNSSIQMGVKKFIYLSTAHVYCNPLQGLITENMCPTNLHPYATSHLAGEKSVLYASRNGEIDGIVLRLSNAFGSPVHPDVNCWMLLVNNLCRQAVETGRLSLHSSGNQVRDFVPLQGVCQIISALIGKNKSSGLNSLFNVGSGISMTILDMAFLVQERYEKMLNARPEIICLKETELVEESSLIYDSKRIREYGCNIYFDIVTEIDHLLKFCIENFSSKK